MVTRTLGLLLLALSGLTLCAQTHGDFAPRGSLVYVRCDDVSGALKKLGGEDWIKQAEDLLRLIPEDMERQAGGIDEARRFIDYLGETELVIADVMAREPNVQLIEVTRLKDGAPKTFSEGFIKQLHEQHDNDADITPTRLKLEDVTIRLHNGLYITTIGGAAENHVRDVLEGVTENSLSGSERFKRWNKGARGDIVAWADMAAWRNAIEKLGEDFDREFKEILDFAEWQKWDQLSASAALGNGIQLQATLTMTEPLKRLGAFMRPAGPMRLPAMLPEETLGFAAVQLGTDHNATLLEVLRVFHDMNEAARPANLERQIGWAERRIKQIPQTIEDVKKDPELTDEEKKEWIESLQEQLENEKEELARLKAELAAAAKSRPFQPDPAARDGRGSEAERTLDELDEFLRTIGTSRVEAANALGTEGVAGALDLVDPVDGRWDSSLENGWFVALEARGNFEELKTRILDRLLGRNLPADLPEEERERLEDAARSLAHYTAHGGEILCNSLGGGGWAVFAGHGIVGIAGNEYTAHRILEAANGTRRLDTRRVAGGMTASKLGWLDVLAVFKSMQVDELAGARRYFSLQDWVFDFAKGFGEGAAVSLHIDEAATAITAKAALAGPRNAEKPLAMLRESMLNARAADHDDYELRALGDGIRRWQVHHKGALAELDEADYRKFVAEATPQALAEKAFYQPYDGLRSAFDPALRERFDAAQRGRSFKIGGEDGLAESGFEWYGLFPARWPEPERDEEGNPVRDYEDYGGGQLRGWIVAAMREPWHVGGRIALLDWNGSVTVRWLHEDDFKLLRAANGRGALAVPEADRVWPELPEWVQWRRVERHSWELRSMQQFLQSRVAQARADGREFKPEFNGGTAEELAKLFGDDDPEWVDWHLNPADLRIWTTDAGVFVKLTVGKHWAETGEKGTTFSWRSQ